MAREYFGSGLITDEDPALVPIPGGGDAPAAGEIITIGISMDDTTPVLPAGFTSVQTGSVGGEVRFLVCNKSSDGTEGGTNISFDVSIAERGAYFVMIHSAVSQTPRASNQATGTSVTPAGSVLSGLSVGDDVHSFLFSDNTATQTIDATLTVLVELTGGSSGNGVAVGQLIADAATEGGFTHALGVSEEWAVVNMAYQPDTDTDPPDETGTDSPTASIAKVTATKALTSDEDGNGYIAVYSTGSTAPVDGAAVENAVVGVGGCLAIGTVALTAAVSADCITGEFVPAIVDVYSTVKDIVANYDAIESHIAVDFSAASFNSGSGFLLEFLLD